MTLDIVCFGLFAYLFIYLSAILFFNELPCSSLTSQGFYNINLFIDLVVDLPVFIVTFGVYHEKLSNGIKGS